MTPINKQMDPIFRATDKPPHIYLDSLCLVQEVKKHPVIYDLDLPERNLLVIFAAWEKVNAALVPLYQFLNENDKINIRRNVRKRWTWMRGLLRRDMLRQRLDSHIRVRWMQEMQFLVPLLIERRQKINRRSPTSSHGPPVSVSSSISSSPRSEETVPSRHSEAVDEFHEVMVQTFVTLFTPSRLHSPSDPDKNFLFALLQFFRKLRPEQKDALRKKIEAIFPE